MPVLCVTGGLQLPGEDGAGTSLLHSLASELCRVITRQLVMLDVISLVNLMEWEALRYREATASIPGLLFPGCDLEKGRKG
jgi:hypothetical protein